MSSAQLSSNGGSSSAQDASYSAHLSNGDGLLASKSYTPTHPSLFTVKFAPGSYNSCLVAVQDFPKGSVIAKMDSAKECGEIRYSTVQVGENRHIELNSDLLYCNHSCNPSVIFDVSKGPQPSDWEAKAWKDVKKGDVLSFFYPSTEWNMSQPFSCNCNSSNCLGEIQGAKYIPKPTLDTYFVNDHIRRLKEQQAEQESK